MAPEKRNTFLDAGDSDEDEGRYDSEDDGLRKGGHGAKRRKIDDVGDDDDDDDDMDDMGSAGEESAEAGQTTARLKQAKSKESKQARSKESKQARSKESKQARSKESKRGQEEENNDDDDDDDDDDDGTTPKKAKKTAKDRTTAKTGSAEGAASKLRGSAKPLTKKNLVATEKAIRRSGVVYLSRIPPFMRPAKLRSLLAPYGTINRTFLSPEDPLAHARRVRGGGNKRRSFVDGWVEFVNKKDAKRAADLLNAQTIGGKKKSYYHDDIWSVVYLRGFKWHHLTEQIATENAERASRMRAELQQTARENRLFLENVERAKMLDGMEAKAAARTATAAAADAPSTAAAPAAAKTAAKAVRSIKQKTMVARPDSKEAQPEHVQRVLSKIF